MALSNLNVPGEWLFKDYHDPAGMAWNWSFLPLDLVLSFTGLWALRLEKRNNPAWRIWAAMSMTLTLCAGLMASSYWMIVQDFDAAWWISNLFLMLWPIPFLVRLRRNS